MTMTQAVKTIDSSDSELVTQSLAGDRDAFGGIVARYQSLLCSLAYSATGSLSQSEDLAQETFVTAWKQLADLREPEKLRSWLCRISRNITYDALRERDGNPFTKPNRWKKSRNHPRLNPRLRTARLAGRRRPSSGVRLSVSQRVTANRSFCIIANIDPLKTWRRLWT